jgi:glycerol uptake facilitator protein
LSNSSLRSFLAEAFGTGLIAFLGLGAVHASVLTGAQQGIWQVAIVWALGIAAAIYCTANVSGAHLNPAITIALALWRGFAWSKVPQYIFGQVCGAMLAALFLFLIFSPHLSAHEKKFHVVRGKPGSELTAMCYGEYFPSPGSLATDMAYSEAAHRELNNLVSPIQAFFSEVIATMILAIVVFAVGDPNNKSAPMANLGPVIVGLTVACLISIFGPLTQACFNPARDFGPRLFSYFAGWGEIAWAVQGSYSWLTVYILAPIVGGILGGGFYRSVLELPPSGTPS